MAVESCPAGGGGADDSISALPNDVLHIVLGRLDCARAAARTSILSRRWRLVWTGLPDLVFRGVAPGKLGPVLSSLHGVSPGASLLDIVLPGPLAGMVHVPALVHAAAELSPVDFRLSQTQPFVHARFPEFRRAAFADLRGVYILFSDPPPSFPALHTLTLTDCLVHLPDLLLNCPRLRALRLKECILCPDVTLRSPALQELAVEIKFKHTNRIDVDAPSLRQLTMHFNTGDELAVSVSAPALEKLTWGCTYIRKAVGLGCWGLVSVDTCSGLARVTRLFFQYYSPAWLRNSEELDFVKEIEKHMVTDLSVLKLYFVTVGMFSDHSWCVSLECNSVGFTGFVRLHGASRSSYMQPPRVKDAENIVLVTWSRTGEAKL